MRFEDASRLCRYGAAKRRSGTGYEWAMNPPEPGLPNNMAQVGHIARSNRWRRLDVNYVGIYDNWEPFSPIDVIEMLGRLAKEDDDGRSLSKGPAPYAQVVARSGARSQA